MAMFNPVSSDTVSPSSIAGALGIYTTNKTWFVMGFTMLFLDEDNWRITAAGGVGSINFQFFLDNPVNTIVPYNTAADFGYIGFQRRIVGKFYLGASYVNTKFKTTTDIFPDTFETTLHGLGLKATLDRRLNLYYPRGGLHTNIKYTAYPEFLGNEFISNRIEIDHNHYFPLRENHDVLAGRFYAGLGIGEVSFNQQFIVGQGSDIRGYSQGTHRGDYLLAIQGEYRWNFFERFGVVGFLGFATLFQAVNEDDSGRIFPGIGTGFRYTVITDNHMNVGMDIAVADGDWGIYFRLGEAF